MSDTSRVMESWQRIARSSIEILGRLVCRLRDEQLVSQKEVFFFEITEAGKEGSQGCGQDPAWNFEEVHGSRLAQCSRAFSTVFRSGSGSSKGLKVKADEFVQRTPQRLQD